MTDQGTGEGWHDIPRDPQWAQQAPPPPPPPPGFPPPYDAYGYGQPYGYTVPYGYGTPGQIRSTGTSMLLFFCTLSIYMYVYNFKVHDEMKRFSGRGIGGGIALLLTFLGQIAMPFVTPAEVGSLYTHRGQRPPVSGWTGLWHLLSLIGGYLGFFIVVLLGVASSDSNGDVSTGGGIAIGVGIVICLAVVLTGSIIWFVKTNRALNAFWASLGVQPGDRPAPTAW